jgi:FKBP-type peptidyl-prolyl cis-trans isomerase FklB
MKYLLVIAIGLILVSCNGNIEDSVDNQIDSTEATPRIEFDTYNEKISYCIGLDHARGCYNAYSSPDLKDKFILSEIELGMLDYLEGNDLRIPFSQKDSIFDLFLVPGGVNDQAVSIEDGSYTVGMDEAFTLISVLVGRRIDQTIEVDFLIKGVKEGMADKPPSMPFMDAKKEIDVYYGNLNKDNGKEFLAQNQTLDSIVVTESGLQYQIIKTGTGISPNVTDSVVIHYTGRFIDGRVFETTVPSNQPFQGSLMGVILGWQEGVMLMKEGGQTRLFIPHELAYGPEGKGRVEPYSTLVFDMELIKVKRFK